MLKAIIAPVSKSHWVIDAMPLIGYNWYAAELEDQTYAEQTAEFVNKCIDATIAAKITSGELAVVKTARIVRRECIRPFASGPVSDVVFECSECGTEATSSRNIFCSVCGARIVE